MKRDMELIRKMLFAAEDHEHGRTPEMKFEGYTDEQIGYHAYLIVDAGLAHGANGTCRGSKSPQWALLWLTWAGHEFIAAARDDSRWKKAMRTIGDAAGNVTFDVLKQYLAGLMKQSLGLPE